jgi:hypothetical protein
MAMEFFAKTCWMCNGSVEQGRAAYVAHLKVCPEMTEFHQQGWPVEPRPEDTQVIPPVTATQPIPVAQPAPAAPVPQQAAAAPPAAPPGKRPDVWDKDGFRRPKEASMYWYQAAWFMAGLIALSWLTSTTGSMLVGGFFAVLCWAQIAWIEYLARCEDRRKVAAVGVGMVVAGELMRQHARHENEKMRGH